MSLILIKVCYVIILFYHSQKNPVSSDLFYVVIKKSINMLDNVNVDLTFHWKHVDINVDEITKL